MVAATCAVAAVGLVVQAGPASADAGVTHIVEFLIPSGESLGDPDVELKDCSIVSCHELLTYYQADTMTLTPSVDPEYAIADYAEFGYGWRIQIQPFSDSGDPATFLTRVAAATLIDISTMTLADAADAFSAAVAVATPGETAYPHIIEYTFTNETGLNPPIDCSYTACPDLEKLSDPDMGFYPTVLNDNVTPSETSGIAAEVFPDGSFVVFQEFSDTGIPATMLNRLGAYWDDTITNRVAFDSALQDAETFAGVATFYPPS